MTEKMNGGEGSHLTPQKQPEADVVPGEVAGQGSAAKTSPAKSKSAESPESSLFSAEGAAKGDVDDAPGNENLPKAKGNLLGGFDSEDEADVNEKTEKENKANPVEAPAGLALDGPNSGLGLSDPALRHALLHPGAREEEDKDSQVLGEAETENDDDADDAPKDSETPGRQEVRFVEPAPPRMPTRREGLDPAAS